MSDTEQASIPVSISESYNVGDQVYATASRSTGTTSNTKTLDWVSHLLDTNFDQKFAAFKHKFDKNSKEAVLLSLN